jgi:hypothetical protein
MINKDEKFLIKKEVVVDNEKDRTLENLDYRILILEKELKETNLKLNHILKILETQSPQVETSSESLTYRKHFYKMNEKNFYTKHNFFVDKKVLKLFLEYCKPYKLQDGVSQGLFDFILKTQPNALEEFQKSLENNNV